MNILKHMEAVFLATLALALSTSYLFDSAPAAKAPAGMVASGAPMQVVVVSAKKLSAQEKAQRG